MNGYLGIYPKGGIFASMKKLVIVGCGYLADIVADALLNGLLCPSMIGGHIFADCGKGREAGCEDGAGGKGLQACTSLEELLALKPDFLVEAVHPWR